MTEEERLAKTDAGDSPFPANWHWINGRPYRPYTSQGLDYEEHGYCPPSHEEWERIVLGQHRRIAALEARAARDEAVCEAARDFAFWDWGSKEQGDESVYDSWRRRRAQLRAALAARDAKGEE